MTEEHLQAIETRTEAMAPPEYIRAAVDGCGEPVDHQPLLDFAAHARQDVPALCAAVRERNAENEQLKRALMASEQLREMLRAWSYLGR